MRWVVGFFIGVVFASSPLWAYRTESPPILTDVGDSNQMTQLNNILLQLWNLANGRYVVDVVTGDPDGVRVGDAGQGVLWMDGTTANWCLNTNNAKDWDCVGLSD